MNELVEKRTALSGQLLAHGSPDLETQAVALRNVQTFNEMLVLVDQLIDALGSSEVIGQSAGMLMARFDLSSDEASTFLERESNRCNVELRSMAEDIVSGALHIHAFERSAPT